MSTDTVLQELKRISHKLDVLGMELRGLSTHLPQERLSSRDARLLDEAIAEHRAGKTVTLEEIDRMLERRAKRHAHRTEPKR